MTSEKQLAKLMSAFIKKNLRGNTPFRSTSDFILYIASKELKIKTEK